MSSQYLNGGIANSGQPYPGLKFKALLKHKKRLKDQMSWKGYRSGHMMYLRKEDLSAANEGIRQFIKQSLPKAGEPAKY
jgi:hypothetical protein